MLFGSRSVCVWGGRTRGGWGRPGCAGRKSRGGSLSSFSLLAIAQNLHIHSFIHSHCRHFFSDEPFSDTRAMTETNQILSLKTLWSRGQQTRHK